MAQTRRDDERISSRHADIYNYTYTYFIEKQTFELRLKDYYIPMPDDAWCTALLRIYLFLFSLSSPLYAPLCRGASNRAEQRCIYSWKTYIRDLRHTLLNHFTFHGFGQTQCSSHTHTRGKRCGDGNNNNYYCRRKRREYIRIYIYLRCATEKMLKNLSEHSHKERGWGWNLHNRCTSLALTSRNYYYTTIAIGT